MVVGGAATLAAITVAVPLVGGVVGSSAGLGSRPAAASETAPAGLGVATRSVHVAEPGDSLWSIAETYRGDVARERYIDRLIDLNGGTAIQAGQAIRLP